jgi:hypothetical protein
MKSGTDSNGIARAAIPSGGAGAGPPGACASSNADEQSGHPRGCPPCARAMLRGMTRAPPTAAPPSMNEPRVPFTTTHLSDEMSSLCGTVRVEPFLGSEGLNSGGTDFYGAPEPSGAPLVNASRIRKLAGSCRARSRAEFFAGAAPLVAEIRYVCAGVSPKSRRYAVPKWP